MKLVSTFTKEAPCRCVVLLTLLLSLTMFSSQVVHAAIPPMNQEIKADAMNQYYRLDSLIKGKIPLSKFNTPEYVHRDPARIVIGSDRDPADVVMRQTMALWKDLSNMPGASVESMKSSLEVLAQKVKTIPAKDTQSRKDLYLDICTLRRRIAFSNPLLDFDKLVFIKHKKNIRSEPLGDHMAGQYYGIHARKGGEGLFILEDVFGTPREVNVIGTQLLDGAYLSPDLSFDGNKILFAYTEADGYCPVERAKEDSTYCFTYSGYQPSFTEKNAWHVFSVNTDGTQLQQLTKGVFNDFDPCWLPNGEVVFISDRRGGFGRCHMNWNGGAPWFTYTLHRMKADGSNMVRLSHHETCEWQPSILHDGNIVYTRWDYVDRGFFQAHHPWTTTPDGRNALSIHGNYPADWKNRPCMEMDIRAIPGSNKLIAVAAAHHGQTYGSIVLVDPEVEDDDAMSPVRMITPDERLPETEYGYFCREASYATPWPLSEDYYICVFGYPEFDPSVKNARDRYTTENYGIYLLDAFGNKELLYKDPEVSCLSPIPLKSRPKPLVQADIVQPYKVNMNDKRWNLARPEQLEELRKIKAENTEEYEPAVVNVMDLYESRHQWPENTKIAALRIIQVLPKSTPGRHNPAIGYGTEKNARVVLGTVPVEEDGSASFYLRPYIPVFFQALDEKGKAVQSMRSDVYAAPKEKVTCVGCHENRKSTPVPKNRITPKAMRRAPSTITPEMDGSNPFNYVRLVQPVLDKHCIECHGESKTKPELTGRYDPEKDTKRQWTESYRNLRPYAFYYDGDGNFVESKTYPGKFGAIDSKLYQLLSAGHKNVKLTDEEMRRITLWLDSNSDFYGTYEDTDAQLRGEIVHPVIE